MNTFYMLDTAKLNAFIIAFNVQKNYEMSAIFTSNYSILKYLREFPGGPVVRT